eukprot:scaffold7542_cov401-Pinguiococcus_pyrenoidosus.AAC.1
MKLCSPRLGERFSITRVSASPPALPLWDGVWRHWRNRMGSLGSPGKTCLMTSSVSCPQKLSPHQRAHSACRSGRGWTLKCRSHRCAGLGFGVPTAHAEQ